MPRRSPFTRMCQTLALMHQGPVADLHAHTTASDGEYTPSQLVASARQARLKFLAVTDHDTTDGIAAAQAAAAGYSLKIIPGVEFSAVFQGRGLHVLGLGIDAKHHDLQRALVEVQTRRRERFLAYAYALGRRGAQFARGYLDGYCDAHSSLGRRHLALALVRTNQATDVQEAFQKWILPLSDEITAKHDTELGTVCELIHAAGGVAIVAHPPSTFLLADFARLKEVGVDGLEAHFPRAEPSRVAELTTWAVRLGWLVSGGSDCHGAEPANRRVGTFGLTASKWAELQGSIQKIEESKIALRTNSSG